MRFDTDNGSTYVIRLANPRPSLAAEVMSAIGEHGANLVLGQGLWKGKVENDVTITIQCTPKILDQLLYALSVLYLEEEFLHVEWHALPTAYVDMEELRRG